LNDFNTISHQIGFWIHLFGNGTDIQYIVYGFSQTDTSIPLNAGWNLIGYPSQNAETVANALWGTGADKVMVGDTSVPYHIKEVGPTYLMKPGEGYWVHVPFDTVWSINW
jgi:hypothetical protein